MCGITGAWKLRDHGNAPVGQAVERMAAALRHRGPDDFGIWVAESSGLALGHRRLAIVDLTQAGHQPMESHSGRFVIVFNGEIYNHLEIRSELERQGTHVPWRGHSDTETLLAAIEAWGMASALRRAYGMFAFALWDARDERLFLARDRLGEKPLYYGHAHGVFAFASELKALRTMPEFRSAIDPSALAAYLRYLYVPEPWSIYQGVQRLKPGHFLEVRDGIPGASQAYWSMTEVIQDADADLLPADYGELCKIVEARLREVVRSQMLSDVPLGSFLSGGIDSSLITAFMQLEATNLVRTYSIGFEDGRFNEAEHARKVAQHLGTEHTEFTVTEAEALAVLPDLPSVYDEPFADSSQIPTLLLSRLARRDITVALTGDGGDEVFGGYNRYTVVPQVWEQIARVPSAGRHVIGRLASGLSRFMNPDSAGLQSLIMKAGLPITALDRAARVGDVIGRVHSVEDLYRELTSHARQPAELMRPGVEEHTPEGIPRSLLPTRGPAEWMMSMDAIGYLPGDILTKVDRAAMSASLETRAPYLDARVVSLAWRLPPGVRIHGRVGKRILRDILCQYVPRSILERPKQGFSIPLDRWLRGELRTWAEDLLSENELRRTGLLNTKAIRMIWSEHLSRRANHGNKLWAVLMFQSWSMATLGVLA